MTYRIDNSWSGALQATVTVTNRATSTLNGWTVGLTMPAGQTISQVYNGSFTQTGTQATIRNAAYNGSVAPGASMSTGMQVTTTGSSAPATNLTLNGNPCGTGPNPTPTTPAPTTPAPTTPAPTTPAPTPTATSPTTGTPVGVNGILHVCGVHLCNQYDKPIQLRGVSTHGLQWFGQCYTAGSLDALANDWHADLLRIAMYVQEGGYETNPTALLNQVNTLVDLAEARGMYAVIDFHTLTPGDPNYNLDRAKTFFAAVAARNANKKNVIYEIANEPHGVSWAAIKTYANQVIPVIRAADPDSVVIVGTPGWSSLGISAGSNESEIVNSPLTQANVMYTFHFYAASHTDTYRAAVTRAAASLPLFVTEFGTVTYTGGGAVDIASSTAWLNLLDSLKISYANWTYSDANESSAAFVPGTCTSGTFTGAGALTQSGAFVSSRINTPDNFPTS